MDMVPDQQVSKPSDGVTVRNLIAGLYFTEIRKRAAVNDFVSGSFVGEVVQVLDQVDSQHQLKIVGFVAARSFIIARLDQLVQLPPWRDGFREIPAYAFLLLLIRHV